MDCCQCEQIESRFDEKKARAKLARYRRVGPEKTTRVLVEALLAEGVAGKRLQDVGAGIGAIQHELFKHGIVAAVNIEASSAYIAACRDEAVRRGHADKITHVHGDFSTMGEMPPTEIVTMERVICCFPDMPGLVTQACENSEEILGLVYPREKWWVKAVMAIFYNLRFRLAGSDFRVFVHPVSKIEALIDRMGFKARSASNVGAWRVAVFRRSA